MGAAASLQAELSKPMDGSDLDGGDPGAAKAEVLRLRALLSKRVSKPLADPAAEWALGYGAYKNLRFEDAAAAGAARDPLILRACDELIKGRGTRTGRVTVLGANTPTSEGYPPQQVEPCEIRVLEHFSNQSEYEAAVAAAGLTSTPTPTTIVEGPMWYIQKNGAGSSEAYVIVGTQTAKSKELVEALIEAHKKIALEQLGSEEGALGYAIVPPVGGADDLMLRNIAWFASSDAHNTHKARKDPARMSAITSFMELIDFGATDVDEAGMREFASAAHLESEGLRKSKGKGVSSIIGFGEEE
jgi:hypothetical protein